jgi:hypothetical protein
MSRPPDTDAAFRRVQRLSKLFKYSYLVFFLSLLATFVTTELPDGYHGSGYPFLLLGEVLAQIVSFCLFFVSAVRIASTVLTAWPADRRRAEEAGLRIRQLELELAEARGEARLPSPPG